MKENRSSRILPILILILSLILAVGAQVVFHACGPKEDGGWMACHWAQQTASALGAVMTVQAVILFLARTRAARAAVSAAIVPAAAMALITPAGLINLCMMADMRCQSIMKPAVRLVAAIILILAAVNAVVNAKADK